MKLLGLFAPLVLAVAAHGQGTAFENGGGGGTSYIQLPTYAQGSQAVWNIPPVILGPTNGTAGDTLTFSNEMFSAWVASGIVETNYCTFTNIFANASVTQQVQTVTLNNGRATGSKSVLVTPLAPVANFTGTPTTGVPPLAVLFTNLTSGTITNALWTFGDGGTSNTLAGSVSYTYAGISTNTVSLTVAGYGTNALVRAGYITAVSNVATGSLTFDGTQNYIATETNTLYQLTPPFTVEVWARMDGADWVGIVYGPENVYTLGWGINSAGAGIPLMSAGVSSSTDNGYIQSPGAMFTDTNWHHLAFIVPTANDTNGMGMFFDGVQVANCVLVPFGTITGVFPIKSVGGVAQGIGPFRISSSVRYATNFTPSVGWTTDANTIGLWNFGDATNSVTAADSASTNSFNLIGTPPPVFGPAPAFP